jgi:phage portal protein BeeE
MVEQLKMTAEMVCTVHHVPAFKVGAGTIPAGQKVEDLNQIYYSDCLHALMDAVATLLTYGLGLDTPKESRTYSVRFDLEDLLKMDSASFISYLKEAVDASIMSPNEAREKIGLPPVAGGDSPMIQQQNYSLAAIDKRDKAPDPFGKAPAPAPAPAPPAQDATEEAAKELTLALIRRFTEAGNVA